jgi:hypothetical protein
MTLMDFSEKDKRRFLKLACDRAVQLGEHYDAKEFMAHLLDLYEWNQGIKKKEIKQ